MAGRRDYLCKPNVKVTANYPNNFIFEFHFSLFVWNICKLLGSRTLVFTNMAVRQRRSSVTEAIKDTTSAVEKKISDTLTVLWADLPTWQQDNHYIHSGYRPASNSFQRSFASLGYLHNESVNIYSHLLGAIVFSISGAVLYLLVKPRYSTAEPADILAFGSFFLGAALCLGMSATYHAVSNHSPRVAKFGNKLDYVGIVCLITGSFIPSIYYGFYCEPALQKIYWTMV